MMLQTWIASKTTSDTQTLECCMAVERIAMQHFVAEQPVGQNKIYLPKLTGGVGPSRSPRWITAINSLTQQICNTGISKLAS